MRMINRVLFGYNNKQTESQTKGRDATVDIICIVQPGATIDERLRVFSIDRARMLLWIYLTTTAGTVGGAVDHDY